ncbi:hypothetical protein AB4Z22_20905, partial [Paenibacillus sp. TAF58]
YSPVALLYVVQHFASKSMLFTRLLQKIQQFQPKAARLPIKGLNYCTAYNIFSFACSKQGN